MERELYFDLSIKVQDLEINKAVISPHDFFDLDDESCELLSQVFSTNHNLKKKSSPVDEIFLLGELTTSLHPDIIVESLKKFQDEQYPMRWSGDLEYSFHEDNYIYEPPDFKRVKTN